jgi:methyl-accepting chemotaxis protein
MTNGIGSATLIDLNRADEKALATLPGIGPKLAARIVHFRDEVHPFEEPVEVTAVPGISEGMYHRFVDRVSVSLPDEEPVLGAEEILGSVEGGEVTETEMDMHAQESAEAVGAQTGELTEKTVAESVDQPEPELISGTPSESGAEVREIKQAESPPPPSNSRPASFGCLRQLLLTSVGVLGGALLALLVLQSINRTLDLSTHPRLLQLGDQVSALEGQDQVLSNEIGELRNRLNQVEALSGRLQNAEADLRTLDQSLATLEAQLGNLEGDVSQTQEAVEQVRSAADRFDNFLTGLKELLLDTQGTPIPATPPATAATPSSTASATSESAGTAEATPTVTRTPRVSRTPTPTP